MSKEEAELELKEQKDGPPEPQPAPAPGPADTDATEADVNEADLERDQDQDQDLEAQEKLPMTAGPGAADGAEKNGAVKLKIPEDEGPEPVHFTGLNKEELLRVAGTPGWVRTRWALLGFFWVAWLGMLAGAVLLVLKAPPCKHLPALSWWNQGPMFHIRSIKDFSPSRNLRGVEQQVDSLLQMKVQALVLGPVHEAPKDDVMGLSFEEVSAEVGSLDQMKSLLETAHRKGLFVVLDLTPNYVGSSGPWFSNSSVSSVTERLKSALVFWLSLGVDGVKLDSLDSLWTLVPSQWNDIRAIVQNWTDSRPHKRLLMGASSLSSAADVSALLGDSEVDLLLAPVLNSRLDATERAQTVHLLSSAHNSTQLLWSLEPAEGAVQSDCNYMDLMLLLTLPGTALIQDQRGTQSVFQERFSRTIQDSDQDQNQTQQEPRPSCSALLASLSSLRARERSLLFGDFSLVHNSSWALGFVRSWDQSPRFLVLFNYSPDRVFSLPGLWPEGGALPGPPGATARVVLSSNSTALSLDSDLDLDQVQLGPQQSVILRLQHG
ncbi:amino acid transporter heavy chain SLC3A2-like [Eucyclogobius newberryi]|uniref:amino acid transporter heavy chain SLC3A2-like n=1 Tax=Eucyclogobius newberryi TaxID=166745 RepID=UPI003B596365